MTTTSVAAAAVTQPVAAPVAQPAGSSLSTSWNKFKTSYETKHNEYVNWTAKNTCNSVNKLALKTTGTDADPADGTLSKIGKVFAVFIATLTLVMPLVAGVGFAYNWIKNKMCGEKTVANQIAAPPTTTTTATTNVANATIATTPVANANGAVVTPVVNANAAVVQQPVQEAAAGQGAVVPPVANANAAAGQEGAAAVVVAQQGVDNNPQPDPAVIIAAINQNQQMPAVVANANVVAQPVDNNNANPVVNADAGAQQQAVDAPIVNGAPHVVVAADLNP